MNGLHQYAQTDCILNLNEINLHGWITALLSKSGDARIIC